MSLPFHSSQCGCAHDTLDAAQLDRLQAALGRIYGRQVQLQVDVDPSVLGGVQVRIGDEVLDGTVARRLAEVRRRLAA